MALIYVAPLTFKTQFLKRERDASIAHVRTIDIFVGISASRVVPSVEFKLFSTRGINPATSEKFGRRTTPSVIAIASENLQKFPERPTLSASAKKKSHSLRDIKSAK